jgi:hypothetical protein
VCVCVAKTPTRVNELLACCGVECHAVLERLGLLANPQMHHVDGGGVGQQATAGKWESSDA